MFCLLQGVFRNLHLGTPSIENVDNALLPRSFNCRLMELTSILGFLASRAELQELYAGGYNEPWHGADGCSVFLMYQDGMKA